jgi:hypothetical protein
MSRGERFGRNGFLVVFANSVNVQIQLRFGIHLGFRWRSMPRFVSGRAFANVPVARLFVCHGRRPCARGIRNESRTPRLLFVSDERRTFGELRNFVRERDYVRNGHGLIVNLPGKLRMEFELDRALL